MVIEASGRGRKSNTWEVSAGALSVVSRNRKLYFLQGHRPNDDQHGGLSTVNALEFIPKLKEQLCVGDVILP